MAFDYYSDLIMGEWKHDKKGSNAKNICYKRQATVTVHKTHAMKYLDPADLQEYKVHGEIILTESKIIEKATSNISFFRGMDFTEKTVKDKIIE